MSVILTKFMNYVCQCLVSAGSPHCIRGDEAQGAKGRDLPSGSLSHRKHVQTSL